MDIIKSIYQIFCRHSVVSKEWYPVDKAGRPLFCDKGYICYCEKCFKEFFIKAPNDALGENDDE